MLRPFLLLSILPLLAFTCVPGSPAADAETTSPAESVSGPDAETEPPSDANSVSDRAEAAGLSPEEAQHLQALGFPILVPSDRHGFEVEWVAAEGEIGAAYTIAYRRPSDGRCFSITGATDGLGGPGFPLESRSAPTPNIPQHIVPAVYRASREFDGEAVESWGEGTLVSDHINADGMHASFQSRATDDCEPLSLDEAVRLMETLRFLDPEDDHDFAPYTPLEVAEDGADFGALTGPDPEALARQHYGQIEDTGEGNTEVTVETVRQTHARSVVLVTMTGLLDDSVRDERLRVVYHRTPEGGWMPVDVQRQVRCQPGRGSQEWDNELCR